MLNFARSERLAIEMKKSCFNDYCIGCGAIAIHEMIRCERNNQISMVKSQFPLSGDRSGQIPAIHRLIAEIDETRVSEIKMIHCFSGSAAHDKAVIFIRNSYYSPCLIVRRRSSEYIISRQPFFPPFLPYLQISSVSIHRQKN